MRYERLGIFCVVVLSVILILSTVTGIFHHNPDVESELKEEITNSVPRTVLVENFGATWCGPCRGAMGALGRLADEYPREQLGILKYHLNDDYSVPGNSERAGSEAYDVPAIPLSFFDGIDGYIGGSNDPYDPNIYNIYKDRIDNALGENTYLYMETKGYPDADGMGVIEATVTANDTVTHSNLWIHFVVVEDHDYWDGDHHIRFTVVLNLDPEEITISQGQTLEFTREFEIDSEWEIDDLYVTAFVQTHDWEDAGSGSYEWREAEVVQASQSPLEAILTEDIELNAGGNSDGWNFISYRYLQGDTSLSAILDDPDNGIAGNYDKVMWYGGATYDITYETIFSDDVEGGDIGYITDTSHLDASRWGIRQHGSSSGDNSWDFGDGMFNKRSDVGMLSWLISPEIDLTGANAPELTFQHWYDWGDTALYDAGNVKISTEGTDGPWTLIIPEEGYDGTVPTDWGNPLGGERAWGGSSGWTTATFDLSEYAGGTVHIRWDAGTEAWDDFNGPGWRIDDIMVTRMVYEISEHATWQSFEPGRAEHFNNLDSWDHSMGIWIHMTTSDTLTVVGTLPDSTTIILNPGWNMVGYPSGTAGNNGLPEEVDKIGYFDGNNPYNLAYDTNPGDFSFSPNQGYWIHNPTDDVLLWRIDF